MDGDARGGGRGAKASCAHWAVRGSAGAPLLPASHCSTGSTACSAPAPAGFPLQHQVCRILCTWRMRCTWMSRHCSSLRGDKGSSMLSCVCAQRPAGGGPALPGPLRGAPRPGGRVLGGPRLQQSRWKLFLSWRHRGARQRRRQLGTLPGGAHHPEGWSLASRAKSSRSRERGVLLPGPRCSATAGHEGAPPSRTHGHNYG